MSIGSLVRIRGEQISSFPACLLLGAKEQIMNASEMGGGQCVLCKYSLFCLLFISLSSLLCSTLEFGEELELFREP